MRQGTCCECGLTTSIRSFYSFNGKTYCEPCVWKASREAKERGEPSEYISLTDNSVCARCGVSAADNGEHAVFGKLPLCPNCARHITDWPYPTWLKASLAALLVLLVVALIHGRQYFHAGRAMYKGERLVDEGRYSEALPYLTETVRIAPQSDKAVLLTAEAALKAGDIETAGKALDGHAGGHFENADDPMFVEVQNLWNRALAAAKKADDASKLAQQEGHAEEAARMMHDAAASYPEAPGLAISAKMFDGGAAYERKDYDSFLAISLKEWKEMPNSRTAAVLASALACKYAVTGDISLRKQSEEMLHSASQLHRMTPRLWQTTRSMLNAFSIALIRERSSAGRSMTADFAKIKTGKTEYVFYSRFRHCRTHLSRRHHPRDRPPFFLQALPVASL